jgi:hypothetical protein
MKNQLTEQDVRRIAKEMIDANYRSGTPINPPHYHNGNDNLQIQEKFVIHNNKYGLNITITEGGGVVTVANGIFNPTAVYFSGIARTPTSGSATTKCQVTGYTQLGQCYFTNGVQLALRPQNVLNANTCTTFENSGGFWVPTVNVDDNHFVSVFDGSFANVITIDVTSFTNTSITFTATCASGWELIGGIIII